MKVCVLIKYCLLNGYQDSVVGVYGYPEDAKNEVSRIIPDEDFYYKIEERIVGSTSVIKQHTTYDKYVYNGCRIWEERE